MIIANSYLNPYFIGSETLSFTLFVTGGRLVACAIDGLAWARNEQHAQPHARVLALPRVHEEARLHRAGPVDPRANGADGLRGVSPAPLGTPPRPGHRGRSEIRLPHIHPGLGIAAAVVEVPRAV